MKAMDGAESFTSICPAPVAPVFRRRLLPLVLVASGWLAALGLLVCSVLPWWGGSQWVFDLLSSFRVHYALCALVLTAGAALCRRWALSGLFLVIALFNGGLTLNFSFTGNRTLPDAPAQRQGVYRLMSFNAWVSNKNLDSTASLILDSRPDIIVLHEFSPARLNELGRALNFYPYVISNGFGRNGSVLISRFPVGVRAMGYSGMGTLSTVVLFPEGREVAFHCVHPPSPLERGAWILRNRILREVSRAVEASAGEVLVFGDFNCTPWSVHFQKLVHSTGLREPGNRFFAGSTWPTWLGEAGIPIDHYLYKGQIETLREWTGPALGSDHYPVFLDFCFKPVL